MSDTNALRAYMRERGYTQEDLALRMNKAWEKLTGKPGTASVRNVHNLVSGRTRWPRSRTRYMLETVFGCTTESLGFSPPKTNARGSGDHSPGHRTVSPGAGVPKSTATSTSTHQGTSPRTVGHSDVRRLRARLDVLTHLDDHGNDIETAATTAANTVNDLLQNGSCSSPVRTRLYATAAEFTSLAAWSCIDGGRLARARQYLEVAGHLAGLSQDGAARFQVWNSVALLTRQQGRFHESVAAARAAKAVPMCRRDPFYSSLALARAALGHAYSHDKQNAQRCLASAQDSLHRADDRTRPSWVSFYGNAELSGIRCIVHQELQQPRKAEFWAHHALAAMPENLPRNRAFYATRAAIAQLRQGEAEQSCATAGDVLPFAGGRTPSGRLGRLFAEFTHELSCRHPTLARRLHVRLTSDSGSVQ